MPVTLNASTSSGLIATSDTSGTIALQSNGSTKATISASGFSYPGGVLQVVSTTKTDTFSFATATPVDITGLSVSITPTSASNKILIICHVGVGGSYWSAGGSPLNLVRNSTNILSASSNGYSVNFNAFAGSAADTAFILTTLPLIFLDSPATTSATTYKLQAVNAGGTTTSYINRSVQDQTNNRTTSTITVMEIAA